MNYLAIFETIITRGFYLLFFCVPLIFTSFNSELFEFNKMVLTYAITVVIIGAWVCKMVLAKKFIYKRTFLEIPLLLYLGSHILSTVFSIDSRTSIFGYYSRFHEGLLATICYLLLYFAAVSNLNADNVKKIFYWSFAAGIIIAVWGTFEHYGYSLSCLFVTGNFDVACWVQDVKNRVYATLGQPNWMAAYLDVLILAGFTFLVKRQKLLVVLFFIALLFTKSRSGVLGLIAGLGVFFVIIFWKNKKEILDPARMTVLGLFLLFGVMFGLPLPKIEGLSLENYFAKPTSTTNSELPASTAKRGEPTPNSGYIDIGISTSSDIRKIVWDGAIKVWQRYPVFGSGVETFAYAYYKDRPAAHNMLSEWDFLYNKAHNEFLNLLATTGTVGIIAYLIVIASAAKQSFRNPALVGAFTTILVTNFFGFSVVIIGLYFFLIPAFCNIMAQQNEN